MKTVKTVRSFPIRRGFTLIELLVVIAIIGILAGLLFPALARGKARAKSIACQNNLGQIQLALQMYTDEHDSKIPPRSYAGAGAAWDDQLQRYYTDRKILRCPVDPANVEQSYLLNGFIDFFVVNSFSGNWNEFFGAYKTGGFPGMKVSNISVPSDTITLGEKRVDSDKDPYMDMWPAEYGSDHLVVVDHGKHRSGGSPRSGNSNYAFADGSVRSLKFGAAFSPKNLWAVTEQFRNAPPALQ